MAHTDGPWHVNRNHDAIYSKSTGQLIADVRCNVYNNSRAIATLPKLLAALEQIRDEARSRLAPDMMYVTPETRLTEKLDRISALASDAIAAATGQDK